MCLFGFKSNVMKVLIATLMWSMMSFSTFQPNSFNGQSNPSLKAERLASISRYVSWPSNYLSAHFVINVYGSENFYQYLQYAYQNRTIKGFPVLVKNITTPEEAEGGHVLYFANAEQTSIKEFMTILDGQPQLTIADDSSESCDLLVIYLTKEGKFHYNLLASEKAQLNVSSRLLEVAESIKD